MAFETSKYIIALSTDVSRGCEYCHEWFDGDRIQAATNHYMQQHGCIVLHIGPQSTQDMDGKTYHTTAVVLGSQSIPSPPKPARFVIKGVTPGALDE